MAGRSDALREVVRDRRSLRAVLAYGLFATAEQGTWIALLVYAYAAGGAAAAGLAAVAQEVPAAIAAPFLSILGDRRRDLALPVAYAAQAVTFGITAVALAAGAPIVIVVGCAAIATAAVTMGRPAHAVVLPLVARTPESLTAANVASGVLENLGNFSGPAIAGIVLSLLGVEAAFAVMALAVALGALLCVGLVGPSASSAAPAAPVDGATVWRETREGLDAVTRDPVVRSLAMMAITCSLIIGALEVLLVSTAVELVDLGESGGGLLNALLGLGGVAGAGLSVSLIGRRALAPPIVAGNVALGLALGAAAGISTVVSIAAFVFCAGAGNAFTGVAARTLMQRLIPTGILSRGFGALEGLHTLALAIGAIVASTLITVVGSRGALALAGTLPLVALLLGFGRLLKADRSAEAPDPLRLTLLRRIPMFAPLPPLALEAVARSLEQVDVAAGTTVMRQGDAGDRFYVLVAGRLSIRKDEVEVAVCEPGGYVGEIALLRDVPRTATVVALEDAVLLALDRTPFLEAVTGHPQSHSAAQDVADARIRNEAGSD